MLRGHMFRIITIRKYVRNTSVPKLQIGCGYNFLNGWLNADIISGDIYLNATKIMPFKDKTFDFIFCEHFIEHISIDNSLKFLKECYRILKKGGIIRITTPDLEKLIKLYFDTNEFVKREELMRVIYGKEASLSPCELFNNYMHHWRHKFIYDKNFLASILMKTGFTNLTFCENKKSNHEALVNLEIHYEDYAWLNPAETFIIEAEKEL
jgi:predicted SAM-dependent methyltransferase